MSSNKDERYLNPQPVPTGPQRADNGQAPKEYSDDMFRDKPIEKLPEPAPDIPDTNSDVYKKSASPTVSTPTAPPIKAVRSKGDTLSITSFVLGLLGLILTCFGFTVILGIASIICGIIALGSECRLKGFAVSGIILGALSIPFSLVMLFEIIVWLL